MIRFECCDTCKNVVQNNKNNYMAMNNYLMVILLSDNACSIMPVIDWVKWMAGNDVEWNECIESITAIAI